MNVGPDRRLDLTTGHTSAQRKTTLKWDENGELTAVDMVRVIDRLTQPELARCDLDPS
jgi:YD repeat-containing protein